jgi:two-component system chemotaxis response regulator CheY
MAKILIVDDSESLRTQLRRDLEEAGHSVVEGGNGLQGLDQLKLNPDLRLVLCDVNMPEMDGLTMCQNVSEDPAYRGLPILMLTTESSPEMKTRGKECGVLAWITKPYVAAKLVAAVDKILKR